MTPSAKTRSLLAAVAIVASAPVAGATPTTTWWAPATPATQPFGVGHLTYDTYFGQEGAYPIDLGATIGVIPGEAVGLELGFDLLYPTTTPDGGLAFPLALNAKLGLVEGATGPWQPGLAIGIYGVGFEPGVTDADVLTVVVGKTLSRVGMVSLGGYYSINDDFLADAAGAAARAGWLASWQSLPVDVPLLDHLEFVADVQTGDSALGAGGLGIYAYFSPAVALGMGPVGFFTPELQPGGASWLWSMQLDIDLDFRPNSLAQSRRERHWSWPGGRQRGW
jgi:hypothetical protein